MYISDISGNNTASQNDTEIIPVDYTVSDPVVESDIKLETAMDSETQSSPAAISVPSRERLALHTEERKELSEGRKAALRIARNYAIITLICLVIGVVYEIFSHGVWSLYMVGAFVIPLALGVLPNLLIGLGGLKTPGMAAENLYACGIATLTIGSLLKGVLEIFGTTNTLLEYYWMAGAGFVVLGAIFYFAQRKAEPEPAAE